MPDLAAGVGITLTPERATNVLRISTDVVSGRLGFATYADLAAETGKDEGTVGEVPTTDAGTHTDPVVGGTVDNSGIFRWSATPAGWERIADVDAVSAEPFATAAALSETNAAASAAAAEATYAPAITKIGKEPDVSDSTYGDSTATTATVSNGSGYAPSVYTTGPGLLESVTLNVSASGTGNLEVLQLVAGVRTIIKTFAITVAGGVETFSDFDNYIIPAGATIAYRRLTGGNLKHTSGAGSHFQYTDADAADGTVTPTAGTSLLALAFTVSHSATAIEPRLASADDAELQFLTEGRDTTATQSATYGSTAPDSSTANNTNAHSAGVPVKRPSLLTGGSVRLSAAAPFRFEVYRPQADSGTWKLVYSASVACPSSGVNSFTLPKPYFKLLPGDEVAARPLSAGSVGRLRFESGTGNAMLFNASTFSAVGATGTATAEGVAIAVSYTVTESANPSARQQIGTSNLYSGSIRGAFTLEKQRFVGTTTPANWVLGAGFTVDDGLDFSGTGSWSDFSYFNAYSNTQKRMAACRFTVADSTSVFALAAQPQTSNLLYGAAFMVDGTANKLRIYYWNGSTTGTLMKETAFAALDTSHTYTLKIDKDGLTVTATLVDLFDQTTTTLAWTFGVDATTTPPLFEGRPGILAISGDFSVQWFDLYSTAPRFLRALIIGDSNIHGTVDTSINPTWAQSLAAARTSGDILLTCKQQDATADMVGRINSDILPYRPEFVVIALGTNDTVQTTWRRNVQAIINAAERVGAEPILVALMPKTSAAALGQAMNDDIRSGWFGNYRYIDLATALSDGHDGVTWVPAYSFAGGDVHLTGAAQAVAFAQAEAEAPYLLGA